MEIQSQVSDLGIGVQKGFCTNERISGGWKEGEWSKVPDYLRGLTEEPYSSRIY